MASNRPSVWTILERLGHRRDRGDREHIVQHAFESASRVTFHSEDGQPIDGGDYLVQLFESLGATKDWPACGSREWSRLRVVALRRILARMAREGLLDAIAVGDETSVISDNGRDARAEGDDDDVAANSDGAHNANTPEGRSPESMPGMGVEVASAFIRRGQDNPRAWFRSLRRETPMSVIWRWAQETCPGVPVENLVVLKDSLTEVAYRDTDGHILGGVMLRALEDELEEGQDDKRWTLVVTYFEEAVDSLRSVFERLGLL